MERHRKLFFGLLVLFVAFLPCCGGGSGQVSASGARQVAPPKVPRNSRDNTTEQQNIHDRITVTTDTTKVLWIHLLALDGKIVRRMPVRCKTTSSGKRLEPKKVVGRNTVGDSDLYPTYNGWYVDELLQPDGTYGESDAYTYWFDPQGRYHQWGTGGGLGYLLTDYPIDLTDPVDEVTGLYKAHEAALVWQKEQESLLREREGKNQGEKR